MKKLIFMMGIATLSYAANGSINPRADATRTFNQQQMNQGQVQMQQNTTSSDCSHLSDQEKQFASQLSDMHRTMFCRHFSVSQRIEAMTLASSNIQDLTGQKTDITPDQAVEVIMKNARQDQSNGNGNGSQQKGQQQNPYSNYGYPSNSSNGQSQSNPYSN